MSEILAESEGFILQKHFKTFMSNDVFYNPLANPRRALLSMKEVVKGRVLPYSGLSALVLLNAGLFLASGFSFAEPVILIMPLVALVVMERKISERFEKFKDSSNFMRYDFSI